MTAASDLNESVSKVGVVFGAAAADIQAWASTAATAMGQSTREALEAAGTFGNLFRAMGLTTDVSADMSKKIIELGSDLASFNNANPEDVLLALRSGLVGETEPLRQFGINLNEARIKAEALRLGLLDAAVDTGKLSAAQETAEKAARKVADSLGKHGAGSTEFADATRDAEQANAKLADVLEGKVPASLDAATKAQAAYSLILEDSKLAQGDFARTSNGLANQMRILKAQLANGRAALGKVFLPAAVSVVTFLTEKGVPGFQKFTAAISGKLTPAFRSFAAELDGVGRPVAGFFAKLGDGIGRGLKFVREFITNFKAELDGVGKPIEGVAAKFGDFVGRILDTLRLVPEAFANAFSGGGATSDGFIGVVERVGGAVGRLARILREDVPAAIADFTAGFKSGAAGIEQSGVEDKVAAIGEKLGSLVLLVKDNPDIFKPIVAALGGLAAALLSLSAASGVLSVLGSLGSTLGGLAAALPLLISPLGIAALTVAALGTAAYLAYKRFTPFRAAVDSVAQTFKAAGFAAAVTEAGVQFGRLWDFVQPKLIEFRDKAIAWVQANGPGILQAFGRALAAAVGFISAEFLAPLGEWFTGTLVPFVRGKLPAVVDAIVGFLRGSEPVVFAAFDRFADAAFAWVEQTAIPKLQETLPQVTAALFDWANENLPAWGAQLALLGLDAIGRLTVTLLTHIPDLFVKIPGQLAVLGGLMVAALFGSIFKDLPGELDRFAAAVVGFVTGLPGRIAEAAVGMFDGIGEAFRAALNTIIGLWNSLPSFKIPGFDPPGPGPSFGGFEFGLPKIDELAGGGVFDRDFTGLLRLAETPAARPEIVTPQRLMAETFRKELAAVGAGGGVNVGSINVTEAQSAAAVIDEVNARLGWKLTTRNER